LVELSELSAQLDLELNVEMPLRMRAAGISDNGVLRKETVSVRLSEGYPWKSPTFYLRSDFPRALPHLQPGPLDQPPRPCLVDGSPDEYFCQFGLVEAGIFHLIHQMVVWLQRAAVGALIDKKQGWEPTLRRNLSNAVVLNAEFTRKLVDRNGGFKFLRARFFRSGNDSDTLAGSATALISSSIHTTPLKKEDTTLFTSSTRPSGAVGNTIVALVWAGKKPDGSDRIIDQYVPETVGNLEDLIERADELGCRAQIDAVISSLEHSFEGCTLPPPVPIGVVVCIQRPIHLIESDSNIEILPYIIEIRGTSERHSLFAQGTLEPVAPAGHLHDTNPDLLRMVSGAPVLPPVALLGAGSVGSKIALHLAKAGAEIVFVSDRASLYPHNFARHGLVRDPLAGSKARELTAELSLLGQRTISEDIDLSRLRNTEVSRRIIPKAAKVALNTTASLVVREAVVSADIGARVMEAALFGRGYGAMLLVEGHDRNPNLSDLAAELYTIGDSYTRALLTDPAVGLGEVQIGQGCSSLTMPMTDSRLSAMSGGLAEQIMAVAPELLAEGQLHTATTSPDSNETIWTQSVVPPFLVIPIEGTGGWTFRISARVLERIRSEMAHHSSVETGGVLIGLASARLKSVTVVDTLAAPPDSTRSASLFVLGTKGLKENIQKRHEESGKTLFDVGTWHSHLGNFGPSETDWITARDLAGQRPPPSALLIATPNGYYGLSASSLG
jgi:hypothetical protein